MNPTTLIFVLLAPLILWRIYIRIKGHIGPQLLRPWRLKLSIFIFILATLVLAVLEPHRSLPFLSLAFGWILGPIVAQSGLRHTLYEEVNGKLFYTPDSRIGITLSVLFIARLVYRIFEAETHHSAPLPGPLTLFLFGLLAGYYVVYYTGVLRHVRSLTPPKGP